MKKFILIVTLLAVLLLAGCRSPKQVVKTTPVYLHNTDSVKIEYIERVVIDTVTVEVAVPAESALQVIPDSASHLETMLAVSDAWINPDGTLGHSLNNKAQSIKAEVPVPVKTIEQKSEASSINEAPVPYPEYVEVERNFSMWEKFRLKAFWYLTAYLIISMVWKFRKPLLALIKH